MTGNHYMLSGLFRDFRYASRSLRKGPGVAAAAIATLALGIGANTAIFSVFQGVVLEPLPFPQPGRLAVVALFNRSLGYATRLSYPDFLDWQRAAKARCLPAIDGRAGFGFNVVQMILQASGKEELDKKQQEGIANAV